MFAIDQEPTTVHSLSIACWTSLAGSGLQNSDTSQWCDTRLATAGQCLSHMV